MVEIMRRPHSEGQHRLVLHEIRLLLSGWAAGEIFFGADNVSDMAGKYDAGSDWHRQAAYCITSTGSSDWVT